MPANVVGPTVRGSDFWGREAEVNDLWRLLDRGSVLLTAPRRYGKSSLMNALADHPKDGWTVLYLDVEYVETPSAFVTELTAALLQLEPFRKLLQGAVGAPGAFLKWVGSFIGDVTAKADGLGEIKIGLREGLQEDSWPELAEQLLRELERFEGKLLLIIDEFPMMLANFLDQDTDLAVDFLKWFRAQRQQRVTSHVRFLLGGSVNIEPRLERLGRQALLNDLERFQLEPLNANRALQFVSEVLTAEKADVEPAVAAEVVRVVDSGVHFFLQVLIAECLAAGRISRQPIIVTDVQSIYEQRVLGPSNRARFSHYRSRLKEYYGALERAAHLILDELACTRERSVADLMECLRRHDETVDIDSVLSLLESDHYVIRDHGLVRFSSGFLRDWWLRNAFRGRGQR